MSKEDRAEHRWYQVVFRVEIRDGKARNKDG
jgi:hypothetical protein